MLLFMEKLYDMHCHVGFAPAPATVAAEGAQAGIGALSCTVEPTEYEQLRAALADAPNVAVALGAHPWWIADGRVGETELARFCELARTTRFIGEIGSTSPARAIRKRAVPCRRALSPVFWPHATSPQRPWHPPIPKARQQPAGKTEPVSQPRAPRRTHPAKAPSPAVPPTLRRSSSPSTPSMPPQQHSMRSNKPAPLRCIA